MKLYEINQQISNCIDFETGEVIDFEKLEQLNIERDVKIENIALAIKNLKAEAEAIKNEKDNLADRQKSIENKAKSLSSYLATQLNGQTFKTAKVACSFRKSSSVIVDESQFIPWAKLNNPSLLTTKEPTPNKTLIKQAITSGADITGAVMETQQNLQIK